MASVTFEHSRNCFFHIKKITMDHGASVPKLVIVCIDQIRRDFGMHDILFR